MPTSTDVLNRAEENRALWPSGIRQPIVTYAVTALCVAIFIWGLWDHSGVYERLVYPLEGLPRSGWASILAQRPNDATAVAKGIEIIGRNARAQTQIVEDLLVAAHADARRKAEALLHDKMKQLTGGVPLPPGLKLF